MRAFFLRKPSIRACYHKYKKKINSNSVICENLYLREIDKTQESRTQICACKQTLQRNLPNDAASLKANKKKPL
jgi:hypothetical protein